MSEKNPLLSMMDILNKSANPGVDSGEKTKEVKEDIKEAPRTAGQFNLLDIKVGKNDVEVSKIDESTEPEASLFSSLGLLKKNLEPNKEVEVVEEVVKEEAQVEPKKLKPVNPLMSSLGGIVSPKTKAKKVLEPISALKKVDEPKEELPTIEEVVTEVEKTEVANPLAGLAKLIQINRDEDASKDVAIEKIEESEEVVAEPSGLAGALSALKIKGIDKTPDLDKDKVIIDEIRDAESQELYSTNLLNPSLNRAFDEISLSIQSYMVWLRSQNIFSFDRFTPTEIVKYYIDKINKPVIVEYALKHARANTLAVIYDLVSSAHLNQNEFAKMKSSYLVSSNEVDSDFGKILYETTEAKKFKKGSSPTKNQLDTLLNNSDKSGLSKTEIMTLNKSEAGVVLGTMFNDNRVVWTYDDKIAADKRAEEYRLSVAKRKGGYKK